jgi:acetyl-CoA synthetase
VAEDIKNFVKTRLAAHEYPREVEFVKELPMTATGKIMRRELKKLEMERKGKSE